LGSNTLFTALFSNSLHLCSIRDSVTHVILVFTKFLAQPV
jgi:hypothetical protein